MDSEQKNRQAVQSDPDLAKSQAEQEQAAQASGTDLHAATMMNDGEQSAIADNGTDLNAATSLGDDPAESPAGQGPQSSGTDLHAATLVGAEASQMSDPNSASSAAPTDLHAATYTDASGIDPRAATAPKATPVPGEDPLAGQVMGSARLVKKLGQGGMGTVYLAEHTTLQKKVAVKLLPARLAERSGEYVERFRREAIAAGKLEQENIVQVYDVNKSGDYWYIIMQYVEGTDLRDLVKARGKLDLQTATGYMLQVARGLDAAHKAQIVHRDIKPENVMLTRDGVCKIADFGLAGLGDSNLTRTGQTMGSPYYMSPEQCAGDGVDIRTDIYALGVTFYYLLTAQHPYTGETPVEIMHKHTNADVPSATDLDGSIPDSASLVIRRMLAKKKDKRYNDPAELIRDLEALREKPEAIPAGAMKAIPPLVSPKAGVAIAAALLLVAFIYFAGTGRNGQTPVVVSGAAMAAAPTVTIGGVSLPVAETAREVKSDEWSTPLRIGAIRVKNPDENSARERLQIMKLQQALAREGIFAVDRENLDKILTELALAKSDLTDKQKRVELGRLFNSHYFFNVDLEAKEPNAEGIVNVSVTVTATSEMPVMEAAIVKTDAKGNIEAEQLNDLAASLAGRIAKLYPVKGRVAKTTDGGGVELNVGRFAGVKKGQAFVALSEEDAETAKLEITEVADDTARAKVVTGEAKLLRAGDRVRLQP